MNYGVFKVTNILSCFLSKVRGLSGKFTDMVNTGANPSMMQNTG